MVSNTYAVILSVLQCDIEYICMNLKKENEIEVRAVFFLFDRGETLIKANYFSAV